MDSTTSFVIAESILGLATTAYNAALPAATILLGSTVLLYIVFVAVVSRDSHTVGSVWKMYVGGKKGSRPPIAPFGMWECIRCMTSEQMPWFPLRARKALNETDTFVLPLPRRPVMTGDFALAREILMDPLSIKPKTYQEFEPFGIGSIFTRNGSYWVSLKQIESFFQSY